MTIEDIEQCLAFAIGEFTLIVNIDLNEAARLARRRGYVLTFERPKEAKLPEGVTDIGDLWWLRPVKPSPSKPEYFAVGPHMVGRLFFEFASLRWLIGESIARMVPAAVEHWNKRNLSAPVDAKP